MQYNFLSDTCIIETDYIHLPDPAFFNLETEFWEEEDYDEDYDEEEFE